MRFEVTHHLPGHDTPTHTLTDAAGVATLLQQAAGTGSRLHIRPWPRRESGVRPSRSPSSAEADHPKVLGQKIEASA